MSSGSQQEMGGEESPWFKTTSECTNQIFSLAHMRFISLPENPGKKAVPWYPETCRLSSSSVFQKHQLSLPLGFIICSLLKVFRHTCLLRSKFYWICIYYEQIFSSPQFIYFAIDVWYISPHLLSFSISLTPTWEPEKHQKKSVIFEHLTAVETDLKRQNHLTNISLTRTYSAVMSGGEMLRANWAKKR